MAELMTKRDRVMATVAGRLVDRPAYSFWRHFYEVEYSPTRAVASILWWQEQTQNDFLKVQLRTTFFTEDWGCVFRYPTSGAVIGGDHRPPAEQGDGSFTPASSPHAMPKLLDYPVKDVDDWGKLRVLAPDEGALGERLQAFRVIRDRVGPDLLFIDSLWSPLFIAARLAGSDDRMLYYLRHHPQVVHEALEVITRTYVSFARASLEAGASGVFFATRWATRDRLDEAEYAEFGRPYDLRVLEAVRDAPFNMLHMCQNNNMLLALSDYPVHAFNWEWAEPGNLDLRQARERISHGALIGGVRRATLAEAAPDRAVAEVREAWEATGGHRWIAGPEESVFSHVPTENVLAVAGFLRGESPAPAV